jgi:leukotriene-A4 hydrolase
MTKYLLKRLSSTLNLTGVLLLAFVLSSPVVAGIYSSLGERGVKTSAGFRALPNSSRSATTDFHSYSNPNDIKVRHLDLDLGVDFEQKILKGTAVLTLERVSQKNSVLILDTRALNISKVEASEEGRSFNDTEFTLGSSDPVLGAPLTIRLPESATRVRIHYSTSPGASGLQWLGPQQTAGKREPFLFTQSQAIHARSWIPLQDTPQVRLTYTAHVRTPSRLLAVMSAENNPNARRDGDYRFRMTQAIPSYLIALAVGDLRFRPLGRRTGVYAEPPVIEKAAREFIDTEKMVAATERLYGPYRWVHAAQLSLRRHGKPQAHVCHADHTGRRP